MNTKRLQAYQQSLSLQDYSGSALALSDLFLAKQIAPAEDVSDRRFVRGNWRVIPQPSHVFYTGQHVFVYYEIYNLIRDEFGATGYSASIEAEATGETWKRMLPFLLIGRGRPEATVVVTFEQTGTDPTVTDYIELDIEDAARGDYRVRMSVRDLSSGEEISKEGMFTIVSERE